MFLLSFFSYEKKNLVGKFTCPFLNPKEDSNLSPDPINLSHFLQRQLCLFLPLYQVLNFDEDKIYV